MKPQFSSVQLLSHVQLFVTPRTAARQASLSITNSRSLFKLMSIESVMPSSRLILCHPLLLPSIFPSIRVFSNKSVLHIRWPKYWSCSFKISPTNEHPGQYASKFGKLSSGHRTGKGQFSFQLPKKGNAKECSNYLTIALISHASKVILEILQARL